MKQFRQGDVFMVRVGNVDNTDIEELPKDNRGLVLAEGETSGHFHALYGRGTKLYRYKATGRMVALVGDEGASMRVVGGGAGGVDRHTEINVPPGTYEIRIQHEWNAAGFPERVND